MSGNDSSPAAPAVDAVYFDGRSTKRHAVRLTLSGDVLHMQGDSAAREAPLAVLRISEPMGAAPRLITFGDGAYCEVRDHTALAHLLAASGHRDRAHIRWQFDLRMVLASCALFLVLTLAGYYIGLPLAAELAAPAVPAGVRQAISEQTLELIDGGMLSASKLAPERTEPIVRRFAAMRAPGGQVVGHRVLFRDGGAFGANAFALPDGTLVVTDQLVQLAANDDEVLAVLTHELGHAARHHGLRMVLQGSLVGLFLTWYIGDASTLLAAAPAALLQARYSRGMESEADTWGAAMLRENGMSPGLLASILERLESAHRGKGIDVPEYLNSHPETEARIRALRGAS
ncbi:MAG: M48 family metallopeptidase [Rhodocyclaceae bacterium]|nr:M48 family metallopeptidase [Rhodocyclaceae bacterium]